MAYKHFSQYSSYDHCKLFDNFQYPKSIRLHSTEDEDTTFAVAERFLNVMISCVEAITFNKGKPTMWENVLLASRKCLTQIPINRNVLATVGAMIEIAIFNDKFSRIVLVLSH